MSFQFHSPYSKDFGHKQEYYTNLPVAMDSLRRSLYIFATLSWSMNCSFGSTRCLAYRMYFFSRSCEFSKVVAVTRKFKNHWFSEHNSVIFSYIFFHD